MSTLNWNSFEGLAGSCDYKWELLCRELVRRTYARFGRFRSLAQQPGVEFHLILDETCSLGAPPRHFGWQCRWYDLDAGRQIGTRRREKIVDAIRKTERHVEGVTDWILWTRHPLTKTDQDWFHSINTSLALDLWDASELEGLLTGESAVLKESFFGELVLDENKLKALHELSMAPIRMRWEPQLHVEVDAENEIREALGMPESWPEVEECTAALKTLRNRISGGSDRLKEKDATRLRDLVRDIEGGVSYLERIQSQMSEGTYLRLLDAIDDTPTSRTSRLSQLRLAANFRAWNDPMALDVASCTSALKKSTRVIGRLKKSLNRKLLAVTGDAGFGKTFLSAELTKATDSSKGGILLHGKHLGKGGTLDDLAKKIPFGGSSFRELLESAEAAASRFGRRMPIVIDGLNESENPDDWMDILSSLQVMLSDKQSCVVIVTLRGAIAERSLPKSIERIHLLGFEFRLREATKRYFDYYKIDAAGAQVPVERMRSPLFLSLFCQSVNPERKNVKTAEDLPRSVTAVFELYRKGVVERASRKLRLSSDQVRKALSNVAMSLWKERTSSFDFESLQSLVGDAPRSWENSLARVLEEEGVLTRNPIFHFPGSFPLPTSEDCNQVSSVLYDAFAGFMIADALLDEYSRSEFPGWIKEHLELLNHRNADRHPLWEDIFDALVGLLPNQHGTQLWKVAPESIRTSALLETIELAAEDIDIETREAMLALAVPSADAPLREIFNRLRPIRTVVGHPFNASFLDKILQSMTVQERDLNWAEWLRRDLENTLYDAQHSAVKWSSHTERSDRDTLKATWITWYLASTVRSIRDFATKALVRFGLHNPSEICRIATNSFHLNDPHVTERAIGAAYGVIMRHQCQADDLLAFAPGFLQELTSLLIEPDATHPTNHWNCRMYVQGIFEMSQTFIPQHVPKKCFDALGNINFAPAPFIAFGSVKHGHPGQIGMDFENYEVGRLFKERHNYDDGYAPFNNAITEIRGRVSELGWQQDLYSDIEESIAHHERFDTRSGKVDRYAKKYGWIGYYEKAGRMADDGILNLRSRNEMTSPVPDIDPSFPEHPRQLDIDIPNWCDGSDDDLDWITSGRVELPPELYKRDTIAANSGGWVAIQGLLARSDRIKSRRCFAFIRGVLVKMEQYDQIYKLIEEEKFLGNSFIPDPPQSIYTFAGEIPWSSQFANSREFEPDEEPYCGSIGGHFRNGPFMEQLAHSFGWESYHSDANEASGWVPSKKFSKRFGLRTDGNDFCQICPDGSLASFSLSGPEGFESHSSLLYLREDLVLKYAEERGLGLLWIAWGRRERKSVDRDPKFRDIYRNYGDCWSKVTPHSSSDIDSSPRQ